MLYREIRLRLLLFSLMKGMLNIINMRHIVRIEHIRDGQGIWRSKYNVYYMFPELSERHATYNPNGMKTPYADGMTFIEDEHYCAYTSIHKLRKWVKPEEIKELTKHGYRVYLLKVPTGKVQIGKSKQQAVFRKEDIYSQIDITDKLITV
jgi:hypothetical protein